MDPGQNTTHPRRLTLASAGCVTSARRADAGGLLRWPVKLLIPLGFLLLVLQGLSEIVKRIAFLLGRIGDPLEPHHEPMVEEFLKGAVE